MNINKEQAKQHLENLSNNWYDDECEDYEIENDCEDADSIPTHKLKSHNYKDLRILEDYLNQDNNIDKAIEEAKNFVSVFIHIKSWIIKIMYFFIIYFFIFNNIKTTVFMFKKIFALSN